MTRSAGTLTPEPVAVDTLLVMAHPGRWLTPEIRFGVFHLIQMVSTAVLGLGVSLGMEFGQRHVPSEPDGAATGSQPVRSETNSTSSASAHEGLRRDGSAAGSRR